MANRTRDILAHYMDIQQCREVLGHHMARHRRIDGATGCWIFTAASVNGSGYPLVKAVPGLRPHPGPGVNASVGFLLHRVALVVRLGADINGVASHLCDVSLCFNPDHLCDETPRDNESRKNCVGELVCAWHGHPIGNFCRHYPQCIRPPRTDLMCCLALKESDPEGWTSPSLPNSRAGGRGASAPHLPPAPQPPESQALLASGAPATSSDTEGPSPSASLRSSPIPSSLAELPVSLPQLQPSSGVALFPSRRFASDAVLPASSELAGPPPCSPGAEPSSSEHLRKQRQGTSPPQSPNRQRLPSSDQAEADAPLRNRVRRRPAGLPSTQQQIQLDDYFAEEEAEDSQYARAAEAIRQTGSNGSSSSWAA